MRNKEKNPHVKDGAERGQKEPRPAGLKPFMPAGLARSEAQSAAIFFSAKYSSTLACVLPKPPTISAYKYPEAAVKESIAEGSQKGSRKDLEDRGIAAERRVSEIHSS